MKKSQYYCMRFYVTYQCNSRCRYCNVWQDERFQKRDELALKEAESLIRQCYEEGIRYIDFTGGEPTLYKDLVELVQYAKSLGIKTEVTSNGISGQPDRLLEAAGCADKFNISLDTLNPDTYKRVRGVDCLERVMETIGKAEKIRCPKIMMVISEDNISELDEMIGYAQQQKAEIYLNPMFSYFDTGGGAADFSREILTRIYEPYTVVMLHFMEFYQHSASAGRPPCSANTRTLTFAPDGSLILPCYHAIQETVPWTGNLSEMLAGETFQRYAGKNDREYCRNCNVIPYFGISFNYRLDPYFLMQSYSEKLNHLKRDFLNQIPELKRNDENLKGQLEELLRLIRSLDVKRDPDDTWLYRAEWTGQGYVTDVYREPLTRMQYQRERSAEDCWQLELVPHHGFDRIYEGVYGKLYEAYQAGAYQEDALRLFQDAEEFQLRWWKWFIGKFMRVSERGGLRAETLWLKQYLRRLSEWGLKKGDRNAAEAAAGLSGALELQNIHDFQKNYIKEETEELP